MTQDTIDQYVRSALLLQGFSLPEDATQEVIGQFARVEAIAHEVTGEELPLGLEPAPVYLP